MAYSGRQGEGSEWWARALGTRLGLWIGDADEGEDGDRDGEGEMAETSV